MHPVSFIVLLCLSQHVSVSLPTPPAVSHDWTTPVSSWRRRPPPSSSSIFPSISSSLHPNPSHATSFSISSSTSSSSSSRPSSGASIFYDDPKSIDILNARVKVQINA